MAAGANVGLFEPEDVMVTSDDDTVGFVLASEIDPVAAALEDCPT